MDLKSYYLFHDCETAGTTKEHALLKYYACICNEYLEIIWESKEYNIFPHKKLMIIDKDAIKYNKIDLSNHIANSDSYEVFIDSLKKEGKIFNNINSNSMKNLIICGHNVGFDNMFMLDIIKNIFSNFYISSKANIDTATIAQYYKLIGKLPEDFQISLENLSKHFNLNYENIHTPKKDVKLTIDILKKFKEID